VQLKSIVSGTTKVWLRERAGDKVTKVFYDPASNYYYLFFINFPFLVGKEAVFEEARSIKGKGEIPPYVKKMYSVD
jgi:hypothetical protein